MNERIQVTNYDYSMSGDLKTVHEARIPLWSRNNCHLHSKSGDPSCTYQEFFLVYADSSH